MIINDLQFNTSLEDVLQELRSQLAVNNIPLLQKEPKPSSNSLQVQCPYHGGGQEKKPSAGIRRTDGMFHCFACNEVHTLPEVISFCFGKYDDIFGKFGWQWLLKNFATIQVEQRKDIELDFGREKKPRQVPQYVSEEELDSYRYYHEYWTYRKITDESLIELFDLGYDKKTQCVTMPVRDIDGNCLFVARRSVNTKFFNYPKGVEKSLYGLYELYQLEEFPEEVYICESMIDALTIWCYNKYAVALNGLGNELSIAQIKKLPCRKVILATDKDDAGKKARIQLRKELNNKIVTELDYRTYPDHAKDMNDMTREEFYALGEVF